MTVPRGQRPGLVLGWVRGYERAALTPDLLAGLTAAAVVLPKAMAYATVAGLPVQIGLYTALVAPIVFAGFAQRGLVFASEFVDEALGRRPSQARPAQAALESTV